MGNQASVVQSEVEGCYYLQYDLSCFLGTQIGIFGSKHLSWLVSFFQSVCFCLISVFLMAQSQDYTGLLILEYNL